MKKTKFFVLNFDPVVKQRTESLKELNALANAPGRTVAVFLRAPYNDREFPLPTHTRGEL